MSVLQALDRYYRRMADRGEAEELGFTRENIGFSLGIGHDGAIVEILDLRQQTGKKLLPRRMAVPRPKRTSNIQANFLWDKTAYAFGIDSGKSKRLADEHASFAAFHREMLLGCDDIHATALLRFIDAWRPERFSHPPFHTSMIDSSFVFHLKGEQRYLHDIRVLRDRWIASLQDNDVPQIMCLVSGRMGPLAAGHPIIKNVEDAQKAGAYLVSFNAAAFTSYNKPVDASNAPVCQDVADRYAAALNALLERGSRNRLPRPIGDATVIFWADAADEETARAAENWFDTAFNPPPEAGNLDGDAPQAARLRDALRRLREGKPIQALDPRLSPGVRFHVLGLSPNAARLSVRFWLSDRFEVFAQRLARHYAALAIEPLPWHAPPAVGWLLVKTTALQQKFDNIPPLLAGEVTRAILAGTPYPRTLLTAALMRLRAGDDPATGWHAAAIRAVLATNASKETPPVSLDRELANPAYQLGRMFAMAEIAQRMALGKVNATIRDRYFGAASATPASVFPLILRGMQNHLSKLRKDGKGGFIEREMEQIFEQLAPGQFPRSLPLEKQGLFVIGYYHQRKARVGGKPVEQIAEEEAPEGDETHG